MLAEVKILIEGYTNADSVGETGEEKTRSTTTLIKDGDLVMVVDPGVLDSQQILVDALEKENLTVKDVNFVCITHSHLDHYRNIGMFPEAKTLEYFGVWNKESSENWQEHFSTNIQVLRTPGHDYTGITLFVTTDTGVVAICGDVFWKENYPEKDEYALDPEKLKESREMVLKMSDWIIPGHGQMYKTKKGGIEELNADKSVIGSGIKPFAICRKCKKIIKDKLGSCRCCPWLCHGCCECGLDCDLCGCSHQR